MKKRMKSWTLATRISVFIIAATVIGLLLWLLVASLITKLIRSDITNQMTDAVESRAAIINNYVTEAEELLTVYSLSSQVQDLVRDQTNPKLLAEAQQYTEDFAAAKNIFEGLYVADIYTRPLVHLNPIAIGKGTREGDRLVDFQNTILKTHGITNIGIMQSPTTGKMVISIYYPIFEKDACIGYVGAAVYADQLMDSLLGLPMEGLPNMKYTFLNAESGVYLYHEDETMLNTETEDPACLEVIKETKAGSEIGSYSDESGVFAVYKYLPERKWVFMVQDSQEEIFRDVKRSWMLTGSVCVFVALLIIAVSRLRLRLIGKDLLKVENAIEKLGRLELSADQNLKKFSRRGDEIGIIAATTIELSRTLYEAVTDVERILSSIAEGNLAVDVTEKETIYIGDFTVLKESLTVIRSKLSELLGDISQVAEQVSEGVGQMSSGAQILAQGAAKQSSSMTELDSMVDDVSTRVNQNAQRSKEASQKAEDTANALDAGRECMGRMKTAMTELNESSAEIGKIIKTIEDIASQTNILALNASVEAARAGAAGKGFAVVAQEIRELARKSTEASQDTAKLIEKSIFAIRKSSETADEAADIMENAASMSETAAALVQEISVATSEQAEAIVQITIGIDQISAVIETNSATAQESAASSQELSSQASILESQVARFRL